MFTYIFKSSLNYYLFKKYKTKLLTLLLNIIILIVITFLYSDIVQFMAINNLKFEILYLILLKWGIYVLSIYKIISIIKSIFVGDEEDKKQYEKELIHEEEILKKTVDERVQKMYNEIKEKPVLKTKKEAIYDKYQQS